MKWYYQQVLKITFVINFVNKTKKPIIIWDADTIILKKILFFKNNNSINYGTTSEFHKAYYKTNKNLLNNQPRYFISSLAQFISITTSEAKFLIKRLSKIKKKRKKIGEWITDVIFKSVVSAHQNYNGSMFSEYELIGQSNLLKSYKKQKLISGIREHLNLNNPIYVPTSAYGHFGRMPDEKIKGSFTWEKLDLIDKLLEEIGKNS